MVSRTDARQTIFPTTWSCSGLVACGAVFPFGVGLIYIYIYFFFCRRPWQVPGRTGQHEVSSVVGAPARVT